jgi:choloylglycine hydrolase
MNDQGLSCGSLWMPDSKYRTAPDPLKKSVFIGMFNNWALGTCASAAEVKDKLQSEEVVLWENGLLQKLNMLPLHFPVMDKDGGSIVVEYTNDDHKPNIYDNTANVLTNAPDFPTQLKLMEQVKQNNGNPITPYNPDSTPYPGNGYGLVGTPGDPTPPSRFSKIGIWKEFAADAGAGYGIANAEDAKILAYHLLNCVDIPDGICRYGTEKDSKGSDYTVWAVVKDLTNLEYQVRMYDSSIPYRFLTMVPSMKTRRYQYQPANWHCRCRYPKSINTNAEGWVIFLFHPYIGLVFIQCKTICIPCHFRLPVDHSTVLIYRVDEITCILIINE